jgi:tetratricopeptide (TPR) repeat protein
MNLFGEEAVEKLRARVLRMLERCESIWTRRVAPIRVLLSTRWGRSIDVAQARQLAQFAPSDYDAQMTAGKVLLYGSGSRLSVIVDAEKCFRRALELSPQSADAMTYVAFSLDCQGKWKQALAVYRRALELDPSHELARTRHAIALEELTIVDEATIPGANRLTASRFPETIASLSDLKRAILENILTPRAKGRLLLTKNTRVVTVGSCFAANLAHALKREGITATNLTVGEVVNSTYANLEFFRWSLGESEVISEEMSRVNRAQVGVLLQGADVIIYTLGVAPCFFDKATGEFVLPQKTAGVRGVLNGKYVFRNTTVEENVANLMSIVELVRRSNADCDFVFSLSPVPLSTTLESRSSMEADCLSKSILRVAVEQTVASTPRCLYWPSFEIVRWLGAYHPHMYGAEDGTTHHVSEHAVEAIISLFLQFYMRPVSEPQLAQRDNELVTQRP